LLRASPAQWFEIVVASEHASETMGILAHRGQIQFERTGGPSAATRFERVQGPLKRYRAPGAELSGYWPTPVFERRSCMLSVEVAAEAAIQQLAMGRRGDRAPDASDPAAPPTGVALFLGNRLWREGTPRVLLIGIGHQLQSTFGLLINTLSFVRVGSFDLAHSAVESAIITVAAGIQSGMASGCVLVAGNLLTVLVEGLVVSVQTTRLVLFEFFMRFDGGHGRPSRPASVPPDQGPAHESG